MDIKQLPNELVSLNKGRKYLFFNPYSGGYVVADEIGAKLIEEYKLNTESVSEKFSRILGISKQDAKNRILSFRDKLDKVRMFSTPEKNMSKILTPQSSCIEVTLSCNLRCKTCYVGTLQQSTQMSIDEIKNVIDQLSTLGVKNISIIGGEPLLRKDVYEIVNHIVKRKVTAGISTNATLLTKKFVKKIRDLGRVWVQVSLDGSTPEINDLNRGKGSFEKAMKGVNLLQKYELRFSLSSVIMKHNFDDMENLCDLAYNLGANSIIFHKLHLSGRAKEHEELIPSSKELTHAMITVLQKGIEYRGKLMVDLPHNRVFAGNNRINVCYLGCHFGRYSIYITSDGGIAACSHLRDGPHLFGNVRKDKISKIWYESKELDKLRNLTVDDIESCSKCKYKYACRGSCRAEAYSEHENIKAECYDCDALKKYYETVFTSLLKTSIPISI